MLTTGPKVHKSLQLLPPATSSSYLLQLLTPATYSSYLLQLLAYHWAEGP
ncbi:hypothetical protein [Persicirhabdus sediminis]|nr:hypothetical protein [Persicirhabdus sediminis]